MKRIILTTKNHPLHPKLKNLKGFGPFKKPIDAQIVFDFTLTSFKQKQDFIHSLSPTPVVSDLTCYPGEMLLKLCKELQGALACAFPSPTNNYEYFAQNNEIKKQIITLFDELKIGGVCISSPGIGFNYPRILSMIINEAYLSLEDRLAEKEAIDTAMKYGVNYPLGPIEWSKKIGTRPIVTLLNELYKNTKNERYKASSLLGRPL